MNCFVIILVLFVTLGVYLHNTRTLCGFTDSSGKKGLRVCDCYGIEISLNPSADSANPIKVVGGKEVYCYGITKQKVQLCRMAPDALLTDIQRFICKEVLK